MRRVHVFTAVVAFGFATAGAARGDVTWATPESQAVTPGAMLSVSIVRAAEFGGIGVALPSTVVREVTNSVAGQPVLSGSFAVTGNVLRFSVTLPRPGIGVFAITLKPTRVEIPTERVERHLRTLYASDDVRAEWRTFPAGSAWRELRTERVKTFVRVGQPASGDHSWTKAAVSGFEIVPDSDPTSLRSGEVFRVRVLGDGRPRAGCIVAFESQDQSREHVATTDEDGHAGASLDTAGTWLVRAIAVRRADEPQCDWKTDVAAMTVGVQSGN
jgi:hypothetical protein